MLGIKGNGTDSSPSKEGINDFTQHSIAAHRLAAIVRLGSESSGDLKFDIEDYLTTAFAKKFAKAKDTAFIGGDGIDKPLGILYTEDGAEIGVTSAATDSISFDELIRLYFREGGDISRCARRLFIHRNTFQYRMDRLEKRTGCKLRDPRSSLLLYLAAREDGEE